MRNIFIGILIHEHVATAFKRIAKKADKKHSEFMTELLELYRVSKLKK